MTDRQFNRLELKDFEEAKGVVSFYYASFNNIDLNGDIVASGAFKKSAAENFPHIYHNRDHCEAVGKPLELGQDKKGAYCVSQLAIKTEDGADCFEQYKAGLIKGHSMEWQTIKSSDDETSGVRTVLEGKLWGVTSITQVPGNLLSQTISIKSFFEVKRSMEEIERFLRAGNISEKAGKQFLEQHEKLNLLAKSLKENLKAGGTTFNDDEPAKGIDYKYLSQNLKFN